MSGTQIVVVKRALHALIAPLFASSDTTVVRYGAAGQIPRELIYLGRAKSQQEPLAMRPVGGRLARKEVISAPVIIRVDYLGGDEEAAEARAVELCTPIEEAAAADPRLGNNALLIVGSTVELPSGGDDDGGFAELTLTFLVTTTLT